MENSPFGRLPPEIRMMVYREVLQETKGIEMAFDDEGEFYFSSSDHGTALAFDALHLRGTCQLMRCETAGLFFSINHVYIYPLDVQYYRIDPSMTEMEENLNKACKTISNSAYFFGSSVFKPRSITFDLGEFDDAFFLNWNEVKTAARHFFQNIPIHISASLVLFEQSGHVAAPIVFSTISFELGDWEGAYQAVDDFAIQYGKRGRQEKKVSRGIGFRTLIDDAKAWIDDMRYRDRK